jgi:hypothetical protein
MNGQEGTSMQERGVKLLCARLTQPWAHVRHGGRNRALAATAQVAYTPGATNNSHIAQQCRQHKREVELLQKPQSIPL